MRIHDFPLSTLAARRADRSRPCAPAWRYCDAILKTTRAFVGGQAPSGGLCLPVRRWKRPAKVGALTAEGGVNAVVNEIPAATGSRPAPTSASSPPCWKKAGSRTPTSSARAACRRKPAAACWRLLARLGLVSERDHAETAAAVLDLPLVSAKDAPELPPEGVALTPKFMKQFHVVPGRRDRRRSVDVLVADPQDVYALDAVRLATGREVRPQRRAALGDRRPDRALARPGPQRDGRDRRDRRRREPATWTTSSTCATSPPKRR